jgi:signal transduction histidine kinase
VVFSSLAAKKISAPFSSLTQHLSEIAERNFCVKLDLPVDDELQGLVKNINSVSQKLETYDKAQKTFLQNASHEFRTPLMSIQSYAEGIRYEVIDNDTAVEVILEETKRMANLVEDLMYLSRLDTIEENYHFADCNIGNLVNSCMDRMNGIANKNNINMIFNDSTDSVEIFADGEKLSRAITNIISNDIRYAKKEVTITLKKSTSNNLLYLTILDDGPGFDPKELPNIFDRFYKGKKGNFGLGLAIAKNVIEKHNGKITAENTETGALFVIKLPITM